MATFESDLAHKFAPTYHASRNERDYLAQLEPQKEPRLALAHPPWRPYVYFSVVKLGTRDGERAYEINYLTIWDWDSGWKGGGPGAHQWDTERTAILAIGPEGSDDPKSYTARQAYYAAHEGMRLFEYSRYVRYSRGRHRGPHVWWSEGKHASYPDYDTLNQSRVLFVDLDVYRKPGHLAKPGEYTLVDAGTWEQPSPAAPWITYTKYWVPNRVPSIYRKLKDGLWDEDENRKRDIRTVTEGQLKEIQSGLGVERTGKLDNATLQRISAALPSDRVWTTQKVTQTEVEELKSVHKIDVSPLL